MFKVTNSLIASVALLLALPAAVQAQDFDCTTNDDNTITITAYLGAGGEVVIPDLIEGLPVTCIGNSAFDSVTSMTGVTIPASVTNLANYAFSSCGLTSVSLPTNLTSTGALVFDSCMSLTNVTLPSGLIQIGNGAFAGCASLEGITLPAGVTAIGDFAFSGSGLAGVALPAGLAAIGEGAFANCAGLADVILPDSVTAIGGNAFYSCTGLTNAVIGGGVTNIGSYAFGDCARLAGVVIPDSVTRIGNGAFSGTGLAGVALPDGLANIGVSVFSRCTNLVSVTMGNSITNIGDNAFSFCSSLTSITIPGGVTRIGNAVFRSCSSLTSVTIPGGVTRIGDSVFDSCNSLTGVFFEGNVPLLGSAVFAGANNATVYYWAWASGWGETFGGRPTAVWTPLTQVSFNHTTNNSTITITGYTGALDVVAIPGVINGLPVTRIGDGAFYSCTNLSTITIPNSITNIGSRVFEACNRLSSITIPGSVTRIELEAFRGCGRLNTIMVDVFNPAYSSVDGVLFDKGPATLIQCPEGRVGSYTVPAGITGISSNAFYACTNLTGITIGSGVTQIGDGAFNGCTSLTGITVNALNTFYRSEEGVLFDNGQATLIQYPPGRLEGYYTVPSSVTRIGDGAFSGCASLIGIYFSGNAPDLGLSVFDGADQSTVYYVSGTTGWTSPFGGRPAERLLQNYAVNNGTITITGYTGDGGEVVLPGTLSGLPVTRIGSGAFYGCTNVTGVTMPDSVTNIGGNAFFACAGLAAITVGRNVTSIGAGAFAACAGLTGITVNAGNAFYSSVDGVLFNKGRTTLIQCPGGKAGNYTIPGGVTNIGAGAFQYCGGLTNVVLPASVADIGVSAFSGCTNLAGVTLPAGITRIGDGAFQYCGGLTNVVIPAAVTNIGASAFDGCAGLASVTLPAGITRIGNNVFSGCTSLGMMMIPAGVTSIGGSAFSNCTSLAGIYFLGNAPVPGASVFAGADQATVYYSSGTTGWGSTFGGRPAVLLTYDYTVDSGTVTITRYTGPGGAVVIPGMVNIIGSNAFFSCTNLTSITIPGSVTHIGASAFFSCTNLLDVVIPDSVASIGDRAFSYCTSLANVTIGSGVTNIGARAFAYCGRLAAVVIPDSVITVGDRAFYNCTSLARAMIGNGVTRIGSSAFQYCRSLSSVTISAGVISIGDEAFSGCTSLAGAYFLGNAPSLGVSVFADDSRAIVYYLSGTTGWGAAFGGRPAALMPYRYTTRDNAITITGYLGAGGDETILDMINGLPVTGIGSNAFHDCTNLTSVVIPDSVTRIGDHAFSGCTGLAGVMIGAGVTYIGEGAFAGCTSLAWIAVDARNPVYASVGGVLFSRDLTMLIQYPPGKAGSYIMPDSVTYIGDHAFSGCAGLAGIYFHGDAPALGVSVFDGAGNAPAYYLPGTSGWDAPFGGCPAVPWAAQVGGAGFGMQEDQFGFTITGHSNMVVVVEACTDLGEPAWSPLQTNTLGDGTSYFSDPKSTNHLGRFYNLRMP
jgi:hypothetical protein